MTRMPKLNLFSTFSFLAVLGVQGWSNTAYAFTFQVDRVSADWEAPSSEGVFQGTATPEDFSPYLVFDSTESYDAISWGDPAVNVPTGGKSGLRFEGGGSQVIEVGYPFLLGRLFHTNNTIYAGTGIDEIDFKVNVDYTVNPNTASAYSETQSFAFRLGIEETFNYRENGQLLDTRDNGLTDWIEGQNCKYAGDGACPDKIFPLEFLSDSTVEIEGADYTLGWVGYGEDAFGSSFTGGISGEGESNQADFYVFGRLAEVSDAEPPQVLIGNDVTVDEGELFGFSVQSPVPGVLYEWDLDGDSVYDDFVGSEGQSIFADEGSYSIRVKTSDGSNSAPSTITVNNVAPEINFLTSDLSILEGESFQFSAEAFDPGIEDILTFDWDLNGDGIFGDWFGRSGEYTFSEVGLFAISLRVSDGDGGEDFGSFNVQVAAAPSDPKSPTEPDPIEVPESSNQIGLALLGLLGSSALARRHYKRLTRNEK